MRNILTITLLSILITSCGSKDGDSKSPSTTTTSESPISGQDDQALAERLIKLGSMDQKELMVMLASSKNYTEYTITNIDKVVNVKCMEGSGLCYFSKKDLK